MLHTAPQGDTKADIESVLGIGEAQRRPRWRRRLIVVLLVVVALGGAYAEFGAGGGKAGLQYRTAIAARGDITVTVTATGTVQPTDEVSVSSELSGIVRKVNADYNAPVTAGDVLVELDDDKLKAELDSARANLDQAKAQVQVAQATVTETQTEQDRAASLANRKFGTPQNLDSARAAHERAVAELASARAAVAAAEAVVKMNETNLSKAKIVSPVDGVVLKRTVEPGQVVAASLQAPDLFIIAQDLTKMEIQVDVDEADIGKVREGQLASFTVDAYPGRKFNGTIAQVRYGSEVMQGVVTYKAVLSAANPDLALRPGMTATAEITVQEVKDALTVPNEALRFTPPAQQSDGDKRNILQTLMFPFPRHRETSHAAAEGQRGVWVLKDGQPQKVPLKTGATDGQRTQVLDGAITAGTKVIVDADQTAR